MNKVLLLSMGVWFLGWLLLFWASLSGFLDFVFVLVYMFLTVVGIFGASGLFSLVATIRRHNEYMKLPQEERDQLEENKKRLRIEAQKQLEKESREMGSGLYCSNCHYQLKLKDLPYKPAFSYYKGVISCPNCGRYINLSKRQFG